MPNEARERAKAWFNYVIAEVSTRPKKPHYFDVVAKFTIDDMRDYLIACWEETDAERRAEKQRRDDS